MKETTKKILMEQMLEIKKRIEELEAREAVRNAIIRHMTKNRTPMSIRRKLREAGKDSA